MISSNQRHDAIDIILECDFVCLTCILFPRDGPAVLTLCTCRQLLGRLVRHSPALLLYHEDTLAPRIEFIKRLFPETPRLLSRAPLLLTHDPETFLLPKIKQLESLLPGVDVLKVVRWALWFCCVGVMFRALWRYCCMVVRYHSAMKVATVREFVVFGLQHGGLMH